MIHDYGDISVFNAPLARQKLGVPANTDPRLSDARPALVPNFCQATDPALSKANGVKPASLWVDTNGGSGKWIIKVRNLQNDGWETPAPVVENQTSNELYRLVADENAQGINEVFAEDEPLD